MPRTFVMLGATLAFIGVAAGAFGAHGLTGRLPDKYLDTWEIAVRYNLYHALALFAVAWAATHWPRHAVGVALAGWLIAVGTMIFSFTLYGLALSAFDKQQASLSFLGAITPIGGVLQLAGWLVLLIAVFRTKYDASPA